MSRNPQRIPTLLDIYSRDTVKESYIKNVVGIAQKTFVDKFLNRWKEKEQQVEKVWLENPNFRMSEVLIKANVLGQFTGNWVYTEDEKFMKQFGIADERLTTIWNKKDGDLPERGIPIKSVSDRDLFLLQENLPEGDDLPVYIQRELDYRKANRITVVETGNPYYTLDID
jgi:hypothetical protein